MIKTIPLTTFLLTYLFVCGALYLIGFWSTFDVDIFSLISLYDIPKNFVYPLMLSQAFYFFNIFTGYYIYQNNLFNEKEDNDSFIEIKDNWSYKKRIIVGIFSSIKLWVAIPVIALPIIINDAYKSVIYWVIVSLILSYYLLFKFINNPFVKSEIPKNLVRFYIGHFLVFFPIACFSSGKVLSLNIYENKNVKYFNVINKTNTNQIKDDKRLKFLGFVSDKYIYSTLDNQKIFILSKEACDGIVISLH